MSRKNNIFKLEQIHTLSNKIEFLTIKDTLNMLNIATVNIRGLIKSRYKLEYFM